MKGDQLYKRIYVSVVFTDFFVAPRWPKKLKNAGNNPVLSRRIACILAAATSTSQKRSREHFIEEFG